MTLRDAIYSIGSTEYTVTRTLVGVYGTDGIYVPGTTSTFTIQAIIQPAIGKDLRVLPDGQRTEEIRSVYTETELKTRTPLNDPDKISIDGEIWEVKAVPKWTALGGSHVIALIARQVIT